MEAKELRIGNWIRFHDKAPRPLREIQIEGIKRDRLKYRNSFESMYCYVEGIPLTEEWLIKFGFEKQGMAFINFSFVVDKWTEGQLMYGWMGGYIEIKHVHQLQNLYFVLTNKEL